MVWITPRRWGPLTSITASRLNTHLRDNMNDLKSFADNPAISFHFAVSTSDFTSTDATPTLIPSLSIPGAKALKATRWTFWLTMTAEGLQAQDLFLTAVCPGGAAGGRWTGGVTGPSAGTNTLNSTNFTSTDGIRLQLNGVGTTDLILVSGSMLLSATASGDIEFRGRQNAGSATATTVFKGAFICAIKTTTATATSS